MHLTLFKTFIMVAKCESFSKASDELFLTQPAVTKQIKLLEEQYGKKLLNRGRKGLALTDEGKIIYEYATRILALVQESRESIRDGDEIKGNLRIASNLTLGVYIIPKIIGYFKKAYPQVIVSMFLDNSENIIQLVKEEHARFGFIGKKMDDPSVVCHRFYQDRFVVVGSKFGDRRKAFSWKSLLKIPFIGREHGSDIRLSYDVWLGDRGIKINPSIELNNTEAIKQAVQADLGFSILPWCTVESDVHAGLLQVLSVPHFNLVQDFYICHYPNKQLSIAERVFLSAIFDQLRFGPLCFPEEFLPEF